MAAKEKGSILGTYCAAGNPHISNCGNQTGIPGISMHHLPKDETIRQAWIRFVHPKFTGKFKLSSKCSAHFDDSCFDMVGSEVRMSLGMSSSCSVLRKNFFSVESNI